MQSLSNKRIFLQYIGTGLVFASMPSIAGSFALTDIGELASGSQTTVYGLSGDGKVGVGTSGSGLSRRAFIYTPSGSIQDLGLLTGTTPLGGTFTHAFGAAISADGSTAVGMVKDSAGAYGQGFYWTQAGGMRGLGYLNGGISSTAYAVSTNGSVIAGIAMDGSNANISKVVMWSGPNKTISTLGLGKITNDGINGDPVPVGISGDGSIIAGYGSNNVSTYAWLWQNGDANLIKFMPTAYSAGYSDGGGGISLDGKVIVGTVSATNNQAYLQAYRFTVANSNLQLLGLLNGSSGAAAYSYGNAVSKDGSVIVGQASDGANSNRDTSFRWSASSGMQTVEAWLASQGVSVAAASPFTTTAYAVSGDGCVVGGQLSNSHGYVARGCNGLGLVDTTEFQNSLNASKSLSAIARNNQNYIIFNGLNGSPMLLTSQPGQFSIAIGGDLGTSDGSGPSSVRLGEIGLVYGLENNMTIKLGLGRSALNQSTYQGGTIKSDGTFFTPEIIAGIGNTPMYLSLLGYYENADLSVKRGYLNAGNQALSFGTSNVKSYGSRLRLDWLGAYHNDKLSLTPNVSINYIKNNYAGYSETGGGFPTRWNSFSENNTQLRLGLDGSYHLNDTVTMTARIVGVHRFENKAPTASGDIIGIGGFTTTATSNQQNWAILGAGAQVKVGSGLVSLSLNASSQDYNTYWVYAGYKHSF